MRPFIVPPDIRDLASQISMVILDVDGVLTDGTLAYSNNGELFKNFNAQDGLGIRLMQSVGIEVAVITARRSPILDKRMTDLRIAHYYTGYDNKLAAFGKLTEKTGVSEHRIAYVGDDVLDLPVMGKVGLPIAVGDAHWSAKSAAKWVVHNFGGRGAVREVADGLIESREDLSNAITQFLNTHVGTSGLDKA
jgi:3-deoxy-D-manno-octulosonate 8-phosphate phosphatase (KDO 8-P phosphatase)